MMPTAQDRPITVVDALHGRAERIIAAIVPRIANGIKDDGSNQPVTWDAGHWVGFKVGDPLVGVLETYNCVRYTRPGGDRNGPALRLFGLTMTDVDEVERTEASIIQSNIVERQRYVIKLPENTKYTEQLKHTFSKTVTEGEAAKEAWEVSAKASLNATYAGIGGSVEAAAKYGQELTQQAGTSTTESDEVTRTLEVQGPADFSYEAYRSLDRERKIVTARCEFDCAVYLEPGPDKYGSFGWDSFWTSFLPVARREAPETEFMYAGFHDNPLTDAELNALADPSRALVRFPINFDNVQTKHIQPV